MEGLQRRFKSTTEPNPEDENEFLDEQQQEELISELRTKNDQSNLAIQRGIILVGVLVSSIYTIFLYDTMFPSTFLSVPHIPNPFNAIPAVTPAPEVSATTSILSLFGSVFTFARGCRLTAMQIIWSPPPPNRGFNKINILTAAPAACLGLIAPAIALYGGVPWLEFGFWSIPFLVLGMMAFAIHMMIQVENNIDDLDKARYKYKGA
ncbi:hypothetical protein O0I10_003736 [Lichtheimia ornata]|uniref:Uncharacterized protein n=1 Tax=Lichtheimia ornata TaxID=688661 RepID=A0AAD7V8Q8_9FUNG|nr:uncharacterized protein O0I10_003736 [Lichtheimia ornata]KAJ8660688.1 hypothetical protein O0I10_003736 [Lichtheimia ornata]